MSAKDYVNPQILRWIRERNGLSTKDAATILDMPVEQLTDWETGETRPTFRQAQKLAQSLHTPFGYLFLAEPPIEYLPLPDLRTVGGAPVPRPSVDLLNTIRQSMQRQAWYLEHLHDQGVEPLPFVGRFTPDACVLDVVADMRAVLGMDLWRRANPPKTPTFAIWSKRQRRQAFWSCVAVSWETTRAIRPPFHPAARIGACVAGQQRHL